jgi:hypothetical protein
VKALSLRQPWAELVIRHGKRIENRRWNTKFRGEFLIHAAKGMTREEYEDAYEFAHDVHAALGLVVPPFDLRPGVDALQRGGIVGVARLVAVVEPTGDASQFVSVPGWHMGEQFGFVLEDVRPTRFVPLRGELGFFNVPEDVARAALEAA